MLDKVWDVESATGKGVLYVGHSKNETSKREIPLNCAAREAITQMLNRADELRPHGAGALHLVREPAPPLRADQAGGEVNGRLAVAVDAAGLPGFRFHDQRYTVVTELLEAGEPEYVMQAVTGQLSKKMLEHYSPQRLKAKGRCSRGWRRGRRRTA